MSEVSRYLGKMVLCKSPVQGTYKVVGVQTNQYNGKVTAVRLKDGDTSFYTEIKNIKILEENDL